MKLYLKSPVYFEITVPDGTDRKAVTELFHKELEISFKRLIKNIKLDESDYSALRKLFGKDIRVRILTERESISRAVIPDPFSSIL